MRWMVVHQSKHAQSRMITALQAGINPKTLPGLPLRASLPQAPSHPNRRYRRRASRPGEEKLTVWSSLKIMLLRNVSNSPFIHINAEGSKRGGEDAHGREKDLAATASTATRHYGFVVGRIGGLCGIGGRRWKMSSGHGCTRGLGGLGVSSRVVVGERCRWDRGAGGELGPASGSLGWSILDRPEYLFIRWVCTK